MNKPLLIIISGLPCTGKTDLGKRLAKEFNLPYISKDGIKELLFDSLGWKDREWSKKLGLTSYDLLYYFAEAQLEAGKSFIIESNFKAKVGTKKFLDWQKKYDYEPLQIVCKTEGKVLFDRFKKRAESGERHPGHVDHLNYKEFEGALLRAEYEPLDIGGEKFEVDTTNFNKIDYKNIFKKIYKGYE